MLRSVHGPCLVRRKIASDLSTTEEGGSL
jgi:hypothetical protein